MSSNNGRCGVDFNRPPAMYWSNTTKISYLQRRIAVYSIMYYQMHESCVSDQYYDAISKQLVELMANSTVAQLEQTQYWYAMYDFDGSTGFDIYSRLNKHDQTYLRTIAQQVSARWKTSGGEIVK